MSLLDEVMDFIRGRVRCPDCGSTNVTAVEAKGVTLELARVNLKCENCGSRWTERELKSISF